MSAQDIKYLIPKRIDDPPKFLFWDYDVAMVFMTALMFGILAGFFLTSVAFGFGLCYGLTKLKAGQQKGYGIHMLYWYLPLNMFKRTPQSSIREFIG